MHLLDHSFWDGVEIESFKLLEVWGCYSNMEAVQDIGDIGNIGIT